MKNDDPWAGMQPYDVRRFGEVILDKKEHTLHPSARLTV